MLAVPVCSLRIKKKKKKYDFSNDLPSKFAIATIIF